jgi:hypothetical protein
MCDRIVEKVVNSHIQDVKDHCGAKSRLRGAAYSKWLSLVQLYTEGHQTKVSLPVYRV